MISKYYIQQKYFLIWGYFYSVCIDASIQPCEGSILENKLVCVSISLFMCLINCVLKVKKWFAVFTFN